MKNRQMQRMGEGMGCRERMSIDPSINHKDGMGMTVNWFCQIHPTRPDWSSWLRARNRSPFSATTSKICDGRQRSDRILPQLMDTLRTTPPQEGRGEM